MPEPGVFVCHHPQVAATKLAHIGAAFHLANHANRLHHQHLHWIPMTVALPSRGWCGSKNIRILVQYCLRWLAASTIVLTQELALGRIHLSIDCVEIGSRALYFEAGADDATPRWVREFASCRLRLKVHRAWDWRHSALLAIYRISISYCRKTLSYCHICSV